MPTILVTFAFRLVLAFKVFDEVYLLTGGGPGTATEVVSFTLYQRFFTEDRAGYGSAMSVAVIFLVSLLLVVALSARRRTRGGRMSERARRGAVAGCHAALVAHGCVAIVLAPVVWVVAAGFRTQISLLIGRVPVHAGAGATSARSCSPRPRTSCSTTATPSSSASPAPRFA